MNIFSVSHPQLPPTTTTLWESIAEMLFTSKMGYWISTAMRCMSHVGSRRSLNTSYPHTVPLILQLENWPYFYFTTITGPLLALTHKQVLNTQLES